MADTPEELALELSRAALESQDRSENQLREKATTLLSAASIVVPVAAVALGSAPVRAAVPLGVAIVAYCWCVRTCGAALLPKDWRTGLLGGELLSMSVGNDIALREIQASAAGYLDASYRRNQEILVHDADQIRTAIIALGVEVFALMVALAGYSDRLTTVEDPPNPRPVPRGSLPLEPPPQVIALEIPPRPRKRSRLRDIAEAILGSRRGRSRPPGVTR